MKRLFLLLSLVLLLGVGLVSATLTDAEGYWAFDTGSGTDAIDSSGNANTGAISGATWTSTANAKLGNSALDFDGTDDYVDFGTGSQFELTDSFSISLWANFDEFKDQPLISKASSTVTERAYYLTMDGSDRIVFDVYSGSTRYDLRQAFPETTGVWVHIVAVQDGTTGNSYLYFDGSQVNTRATTSLGSNSGEGRKLQAGNNDGSAVYFNGRLDEVAVYPFALSSAEVSTLYDSGAGFNPYASPPPAVSGNLTFSALEVVSALNVSLFNVTIGAVTEDQDFVWELAPNNYTAIFSKNGWYPVNLTVEVFENQSTNYVFEDVYNHILQLSVNDLSGAGNPNNFSVNITNDDYPSWYQFLSVEANTTEVNTSLPATTAYTTSASYVLMATLLPDVGVVNPVLTELYLTRGHANSECELRTTVNYASGGSDVILTSFGNAGNSGTSGSALSGFNSSLVVEDVVFEMRRTAGSGSGCRLVQPATYITVKEAPSVFANLVHGNYTVTLESAGWVANNYSVSLNSSVNFTSFVMDAFVPSTIFFEFRDASNSSLIDDRLVTVLMEGSTADYMFTSSTGFLTAAPVNSDTYEVTISAANYTDLSLFVTTADDNQTVVAFLTSGGAEILFLVRDTLGNDVSQATLTFLRTINGSQVVVGQTVSDFSGAATTNLLSGVEYSFTVEHPDYAVFADVIIPNPALSPYVVRLRPLQEEVFVSPLQRVKVFVRGPVIPVDKSWAYFELETQSSSGLLQWFSADSDYLSVSYGGNVSGSPGGGIIPINITNLNVSEDNVVTIDFAFKAVGFDSVTWSQDFELSEYSPGDYTIQRVLEGARSSLGAVGGAILGTILVLLSIAAVSVGARNVSVGAIAGLFALGVMTWVGLFSLTYGLLAAVFIGMLIVADNIVGGVV